MTRVASQLFSWKRFWFPREAAANFDFEGYLLDPEDEYWRELQSELVDFESIASKSCLVLLGEPGIGKSEAIREQLNLQAEQLRGSPDKLLHIDLRSYGSEDRLCRELFEDKDFTEWANGTHRLYLFLDSLDECLLQIKTVVAILSDKLPHYPTERLNLRIACRAAEWPNMLEEVLGKLYSASDSNFGIYQLAPLRRVDVEEASSSSGIDPPAFLDAIRQVSAVPFAIKPVTLKFLLNTFAAENRLPQSQLELYEKGSRLLCEETNANRRTSGNVGQFTTNQRFVVAGRIASVMTLGNRSSVADSHDATNISSEQITDSEMAGGVEKDGDEFRVTEAAVRETLETGLFSLRGVHQIGWAHRTYAEYLTARYLSQREMSATQLLSLFVNAEDPEFQIVPQLHETAAWLSSMSPSFFQEVARRNPELLLRSDVTAADPKDRASLTASLLASYDQQLIYDDWKYRFSYHKLKHPDLVNQVLPYIRNKDKNVVVRRGAIDIAEACKLTEVQNDLLRIALDPRENHHIRFQAAHAIVEFSDDSALLQLRPLAEGTLGDDADDSLKACGLRAVYPRFATFSEILPLLTPPKSAVIGGSYYDYLSTLAPSLTTENLVEALTWATGINATGFGPIAVLVNSLIRKAWENLDAAGVSVALATLIFSRIRGSFEVFHLHSDVIDFSSAIEQEPIKRRHLIADMLAASDGSEADLAHITFSRPRIVLPQDFGWLMEFIADHGGGTANVTAVRLIGRMYDIRDAGQTEAIIHRSAEDPAFANEFRWLLEPIILGTAQAEKLKSDHYEAQTLSEMIESRATEEIREDRTLELLAQYELGDAFDFWQVNMSMVRSPGGQNTYGEQDPDLTQTGTWLRGDESMRSRILTAAERFIVHASSQPEKWMQQGLHSRSADAGYRALFLLMKMNPETVSSFVPEIWKKWASSIVAVRTFGHIEDEELDSQLVSFAFRHAPGESLDALDATLNLECIQQDHIYVLPRIKHIWTEAIAELLLTKATRLDMKAGCISELLDLLIDHQVSKAVGLAGSLASATDVQSEFSIIAGCVLARHPGIAWQTVWPLIRDNPRYGRLVLEKLASFSFSDDSKVYSGLREEDLADLIVWLFRQYPVTDEANPPHGAVGPEFQIASWRDGSLTELKIRGTYAACAQLNRIIEQLPQYPWLKWHLREALTLARQNTWKPPMPGELMKLFANKSARLVQSGSQLLDVIIESLQRLQIKLHDFLPATADLWNNSEGIFRPKSENELSDYVARHLKDDLSSRGIVANREVEIRRKQGDGAPGQRTDIYVNATTDGSTSRFDIITAVIETKGCWNPDLSHAMKTQLVDRYLAESQCAYGLYLIGWFNCNQWDREDSRRNAAPWVEASEMQEKYAAQAVTLSQHGRLIKAFVLDVALR